MMLFVGIGAWLGLGQDYLSWRCLGGCRLGEIRQVVGDGTVFGYRIIHIRDSGFGILQTSEEVSLMLCKLEALMCMYVCRRIV